MRFGQHLGLVMGFIPLLCFRTLITFRFLEETVNLTISNPLITNKYQ